MKENNSGKNSLLPNGKEEKEEEKILVDPYGRKVTGLRISITDRCNLSCMYCHNEGADCCACGPLGHEMSPELICGIIREAAKFGVRKVKFSGGEPLFRKDFEEILACLPPLKEVSATTNGILLEKRAKALKASGLDRVNVSLDSLDPKSMRRLPGLRQALLRELSKALIAQLKPG